MTECYLGNLILHCLPGQIIRIGDGQFELTEPLALRAEDGSLFPLSASVAAQVLPGITVRLAERQAPGRVAIAIAAPAATIIRAMEKGAAE